MPTSVAKGGTVPATYTVTNTSGEALPTNIAFLPPNVVQAANSTCLVTPTLNNGASCTLNLTISGAVDKNDANQYHHLFVCVSYQGELSGCTGPSVANQLNVTVTGGGGKTLSSIAVTPTSETIAAPLGGQQLTATGTYSDNTTQDITGTVTWASSNTAVATVSSTGLVTGGTTASTATVTATLSGKTSNDSTVTTIPAFVWAGNIGSQYVTYCSVAVSTGLLTCTLDNTTATGISSPSAIAHAIVNGTQYVYITNGGNVSHCSLNTNGSINICTPDLTGLSSTFGTAVNAAGTFAYTYNATSSVSYCSIAPSTGDLTCTPVDLSSLGLDPYGAPVVVTIGSNSYLYLIDQAADKIVDCPINATTGAITASTCVKTASYTGIEASGIASATVAGAPYIYLSGTGITYCPVITSGASEGTIGTCATPVNTGTNFTQIAINSSGTYAYATVGGGTTVDIFSINATTGALTYVRTTGSNITGANSIAIN